MHGTTTHKPLLIFVVEALILGALACALFLMLYPSTHGSTLFGLSRSLKPLAFESVLPVALGGTGVTDRNNFVEDFDVASLSFSQIPLPVEVGGTGYASKEEFRSNVPFLTSDIGGDFKVGRTAYGSASVALGVDNQDMVIDAKGGDILSTRSIETVSLNAAATRAFLDNYVGGFVMLEGVVAYSALNMDATYDSGVHGVGATLTAAQVGALVLSGHTFTSGDVGARVLINAQLQKHHNGVYVVTQAGDGASAWVLTRAPDCDGSDGNELVVGSIVIVSEGVDVGKRFVLFVSDVDLSEPPFVSLANTSVEPITFAQMSDATDLTFLSGITSTAFPPSTAYGIASDGTKLRLSQRGSLSFNSVTPSMPLNVWTDIPLPATSGSFFTVVSEKYIKNTTAATLLWPVLMGFRGNTGMLVTTVVQHQIILCDADGNDTDDVYWTRVPIPWSNQRASARVETFVNVPPGWSLRFQLFYNNDVEITFSLKINIPTFRDVWTA